MVDGEAPQVGRTRPGDAGKPTEVQQAPRRGHGVVAPQTQLLGDARRHEVGTPVPLDDEGLVEAPLGNPPAVAVHEVLGRERGAVMNHIDHDPVVQRNAHVRTVFVGLEDKGRDLASAVADLGAAVGHEGSNHEPRG